MSTEAGVEERRVRVLVVESDPDLRRLLLRVLEVGNFDVQQASSCLDALEQLTEAAARPDVVVMELVLTDDFALKLLRYIRRQPYLRDMPVVVLTGRTGVDAQEMALRAGADHFVAKPFSGERLRRLINELAQGGRATLKGGDVQRVHTFIEPEHRSA